MNCKYKMYLVLLTALSFLYPQLALAVDNDNQGAPLKKAQPAYGISERLYRWDAPIDMVYNPTNAIDVPMLKWLENAGNIWERVSGVRFNEISIDSNATDDRTSACNRNSDNRVSILWTTFDEGIPDKANAGPSGCIKNPDTGRLIIEEGNINLGATESLWTAFPLTAANFETDRSLTHELGHLIGFGHSNNPKSNMFAGPYNHLVYPQDDDIRAAQVLYGKTNNFVDRATLSLEWGLPTRLNSELFFSTIIPSNVNYKEPGLYFYDNEDGWDLTKTHSVLTGQSLSKGSYIFNGWTDKFTAEESDKQRVYHALLTDPFGVPIFQTKATEKECINPRTIDSKNWCLIYVTAPTTQIETLGDGLYDFYIILEDKIIYQSNIEIEQTTAINYNQNPVSSIKVFESDKDTEAEFALTATDDSGEGVFATYISAGTHSNSNGRYTIDFGFSGWHELFIDVFDGEPRYGYDEEGERLPIIDGVCCAGTGFQTLSRVLVHTPTDQYPVRSYITDTNFAYIEQPTDSYNDSGKVIRIKDTLNPTGTKIGFSTSTDRWKSNTNPTVISPEDFVNVVTKIVPDSSDIGNNIEFFVVIKTKINNQIKLFYMNEDMSLTQWNGQMARLEPMWEINEPENLSAYRKSWDFEIISGQLNIGEHSFFVGYRNKNTGGAIHANIKGYKVTVE